MFSYLQFVLSIAQRIPILFDRFFSGACGLSMFARFFSHSAPNGMRLYFLREYAHYIVANCLWYGFKSILYSKRGIGIFWRSFSISYYVGICRYLCMQMVEGIVTRGAAEQHIRACRSILLFKWNKFHNIRFLLWGTWNILLFASTLTCVCR